MNTVVFLNRVKTICFSTKPKHQIKTLIKILSICYIKMYGWENKTPISKLYNIIEPPLEYQRCRLHQLNNNWKIYLRNKIYCKGHTIYIYDEDKFFVQHCLFYLISKANFNLNGVEVHHFLNLYTDS
jgi:hypothetical protein